MKKDFKEVLLFTAIGMFLLGMGYLLGVSDPVNMCKRRHQNVIPDGRIVIIPVDTIDGRPIFDVVVSDENVVESMYAEEIANSINSGKWEYNEMLEIKEKAE